MQVVFIIPVIHSVYYLNLNVYCSGDVSTHLWRYPVHNHSSVLVSFVDSHHFIQYCVVDRSNEFRN